MRHGKKVNHLSRTSSHRKAMLSNMASSLILHKRIKTTTVKAKALRVYVEPLITKSKHDTTASRRTVFSYLQNKAAVNELFRNVSVAVKDRQGGYTRIIKLENRKGDNAEMCFIELVDFNQLLLDVKASEKKATRRSRRSGKKSSVAKTVDNVKDKVDNVVDDVKEKTNDVIEKTSEVIDDVKEKTSEVVDKVTDKAAEIVDDIKEETAELKDKAKDVIEDVIPKEKSDDKDLADNSSEEKQDTKA